MSLNSWVAEFYPLDAYEATNSEEAALEHSLRKWNGLLPEALARHEVVKGHGSITDSEFASLRIDATTCALCELHIDDDCSGCSVFSSRGGVKCDRPTRNEDGARQGFGPWQTWTRDDNPYAMLSALHKAVIWLKQQKGA